MRIVAPLVRRSVVLRAVAVLAAAVLAVIGVACGGDDDPDQQAGPPRITVWSLESQPDRLAATQENVERFTRQTGIEVQLVGIPDGGLPARMGEALDQGRLPDVVQLPIDNVHEYAQEGLLDAAAAQDVVFRLGDDTFSQTALTLVTRDGRISAVPSDGWGQLLIYRKDLFEEAGLDAPRTLEDVRRAAARLDRPGRAGITLATATADQFTAETFEHVALAAGCSLVNSQGRVLLETPPCREAFRFYVDIARNYSVGGVQDVETTRDAYFAGRAAMIFWSPFLLDAMAGLRDDARPTCPECAEDRAFLARNSGLVGALSTADGEPAQYGSVTTWGIFRGPDVQPAMRFVEYMLSDGYMRWLALSPQGKYPVRAGKTAGSTEYFDAWERLESGVDRKAPLREFYSEAAIAGIRDGAARFQRWVYDQNQSALLGALRGPQPISRALAGAIEGRLSVAAAVSQAQAGVERVQRGLGP